jgi:hypothetical protein
MQPRHGEYLQTKPSFLRHSATQSYAPLHCKLERSNSSNNATPSLITSPPFSRPTTLPIQRIYRGAASTATCCVCTRMLKTSPEPKFTSSAYPSGVPSEDAVLFVYNGVRLKDLLLQLAVRTCPWAATYTALWPLPSGAEEIVNQTIE